jgi:hypothetical protein
VFGPGQALSNPYTGVLANFGSRLMNGQAPLVFEDSAQQRDFVHVRDVARAFRMAMEEPRAAGHVINVGSGRSYGIADVARLLAGAMGGPERGPHILMRARAGDIRHCFADITKARTLLGFEPRLFLENCMAKWLIGSPRPKRPMAATMRGVNSERAGCCHERGIGWAPPRLWLCRMVPAGRIQARRSGSGRYGGRGRVVLAHPHLLGRLLQ